MSSCNFSEPHRPSYFIDLFEKGYIFPSVFIATIIASFLTIFYQFDFLSQIVSSGSKTFALISLIFYLVLIFGYMIACIKNPKVGSNDCFNIGLFLAGLFYLVFVIVYRESLLDLNHIFISLALIIPGIVITLIRTALYDFYDESEEYSGNKVFTYFYKVFKKFDFIAVFAFTVLFNCIAFVFFNLKYDVIGIMSSDGVVNTSDLFFPAIMATAKDNIVLLAIAAIGVVAIIFYAVASLRKSVIGGLDVAVCSFIFNIPLMFASVILLEKGENNILFALGLTVLFIVLFIFRLTSYDKDRIPTPKTKFFQNLFNNRESMGLLGVAALIVAFSNIASKMDTLSCCIVDGKLNLYIGLFPFILLCTACAFGFIWFGVGLIRIIFDVDKKRVVKYDKYLIANMAFALFYLVAIIFAYDELVIKNVVILGSYLFISAGIMVARKKSVK